MKEELDEIKKKPDSKQSEDSKKEVSPKDKSEDLINDDDDDEFVEGLLVNILTCV